MATRPDRTVGLKKAPARKSATRKTAAGNKAVAAPAAKKTAEGLLRAGLKALGSVRDDVARRQHNVIEGLLGIQKADAPRAFPGLDTFGIRKFEDVFDQRVATALQRLGMPTADEVQALRDEVRQLRQQLARTTAPDGVPAPKRKR
ncbi:phasin family protein [Variovorax sp. PAMC 28711]|uniref:phasin family protein n=1 Tax=Variovorax sp. PAMC 28711 TaxID=1795631 RepID=UPI00078E04A2|nr:phasin family protein [Variovorax sp. PAMC 28711]AMM24369.1 poly granule associated family protein [Variovorax sp. PAMC 28711]